MRCCVTLFYIGNIQKKVPESKILALSFEINSLDYFASFASFNANVVV